MAGEPILVATNCAVILVVESLVSGTVSSEASVDFGMMTLLAQAIDAPILQLGAAIIDEIEGRPKTTCDTCHKIARIQAIHRLDSAGS